MTAEVIRLETNIADIVELNPDDILEANKGKFQQLAIVGYDLEGNITICSTHGSREILWMLERAKAHLLLETE